MVEAEIFFASFCYGLVLLAGFKIVVLWTLCVISVHDFEGEFWNTLLNLRKYSHETMAVVIFLAVIYE